MGFNMGDRAGTTLKGYDLDERIGSGGFGAVYLARQTTVGREVAVKIILPGFAGRPDFIRRFEAEAHLIANLEHLHIVPLYDFWRDPAGAYLVMRYLRGGSVRDALRWGPLDLEATARLLDQVGSALAAAHRHRIVHRDIKPSNILLDEDGNAYLSDFGIAMQLRDPRRDGVADEPIAGSLDYLSPEQARGETVTGRTDIYSLGVTLYELVTGEHPFGEFSTVERLYKHINDPLPEVTTLDADVRDAVNVVIQRATAKNPAHRYADALEMAAAFRQAAALDRVRPAAGLLEQLTPREQDILRLLMEGLSNAAIAERLFITVSTVKWYNQQLYGKLGVRSRVQAVNRAREMRLFAPVPIEPAVNDPPASASLYLPEPENPYKGLRAFSAADRHDFFGREETVDRLVHRLADSERFAPFLAIVGPSGSGKSSVVRAGVVPALLNGGLPGSERWFRAEMMPGAHPLDDLEVALIKVAADQGANIHAQLRRDARGLVRVAQLILPDDDSRLLLVIDQFEEVFTLVEGEAVRQHFLDLLYAAATDPRSRVCVIVTLRADYYDRPLQYPQFGEMLRRRMETILPLSARDLERAITGPAKRVHVTFEDGLVADIVGALTYQASALPLLQYALTELFEQRAGRVLTRRAYQALGGAVGALAKRADAIYLELDAAGQALARQLFLRLFAVGEGADVTRRRVARAELLALTGDAAQMDEIIDTFAHHRLLTFDHDPASRRPTVEVAHEAILREWDRLGRWLDESQHALRVQRQLTRMAREWERSDRDESFLLRGARLSEFEQWARGTDLALTGVERAFLDASATQREDQAAATEQRQAYAARLERRAQNVMRLLLVVFAVAAVVAGGLALFAFGQRDRARTALADVEQRAAELQASNQILSSREALQAHRPELALALALEGTAGGLAPASADRLLYDIANTPGVVGYFPPPGFAVSDIEFDPTAGRGRFFAAHGYGWFDESRPDALETNHVRLWDVTTGQVLRQYAGSTAGINDIAVSPDGATLLAAADDGTFFQWDVASGAPAREFADLARASRVDFVDESGELALFYSVRIEEQLVDNVRRFRLAESALVLRDLRRGTVAHRFADEDPSTVIRDYAFQPETGRLVTEHGVSAFGFNESASRQLRLWDIRSGAVVASIAVEDNAAGEIVFDTARETGAGLDLVGDRVVFATTRDWSPVDQQCQPAVYTWRLDTQSLDTIELSPVISRSPDRDCKIFRQLPGQGNLMALPLGALEVQASVLDPATGETPVVLRAAGWPVFSADRRYVLLVDNNFGVLYETDTWRELFRVAAEDTANPFAIEAAVWVEDARIQLLTGHVDGSIRHWVVDDFDVEGEAGVQVETRQAPLAVALSPDGGTALVGGGIPAGESPTPQELFLLDVTTGERLRDLVGHDATIWDVRFAADGRRAVSLSADLSVIVWDVATGEPLHRVRLDATTPGFGLAVSPDGKTAYVGVGTPEVDRTFAADVVIVDIEAGVVRQTVDLPAIADHEHVWAIDVSPDGRLIALATQTTRRAGATALIVDAQTWDVLHDLPAGLAQLDAMGSESVAFSPDGALLAVASIGLGVTLWDVATGELIRSLSSSIDTQFHLVRFNGDGSRLAASRGDFGEGRARDNHVTVWDVATGDEIGVLRGHTQWVRGLDFADDGATIISASGDFSVRVWDLGVLSVRDWLLRNRANPRDYCDTQRSDDGHWLCDTLP